MGRCLYGRAGDRIRSHDALRSNLLTQPPNLLFLLADQLRADFLGCYGAGFIATPRIDSLAAQGVRYTRAYSPSPICVPARASLLTGMDAVKNGVTDNGHWLRPDLHALGVQTWPELLAGAGYYTAAVGKMHFYPWDTQHGFQYKVGAEDKRWINIRDDYYHFLAAHGYRKLHGNEHAGYHEHKGAIVNRIPWEYSVDHFVGQEACRFIRTYGAEQPFALMVGFPGPHCPYDPNEEFLRDVDPAAMPAAIPFVDENSARLRAANIQGNRQPWNGVDYSEFTAAQKQKIRSHYAAQVKQIDYEVGEILAALGETGLLDNTVVVFASDHGDYLGDHDLIGKGTFYEGSIHIPLLVRQPQAAVAQTIDELVTLTDVTATLLALAGVALPTHMDAIPLPGLGLAGSQARDASVGMTANGWMLFDGMWKLVKYAGGDIHLFNLREDPNEQRNQIRDPAYLERYLAMEAQLTQSIMRSLRVAQTDQALDIHNAYWDDRTYGKEGWRRPYPQMYA
jgi:arylsulfatase A-like enzyme